MITASESIVAGPGRGKRNGYEAQCIRISSAPKRSAGVVPSVAFVLCGIKLTPETAGSGVKAFEICWRLLDALCTDDEKEHYKAV